MFLSLTFTKTYILNNWGMCTQNLHLSLPLAFLLTIYKPFARLHLSCGDVIYGQANNYTSQIRPNRFNILLPGVILG